MEMRHLVDDESSVEASCEQFETHRGVCQMNDFSAANSRVNLKKQLSLVYAVAVVAGTMIGSGIFFTPHRVLEHSGSAGASLLVWILAGRTR